MDSGYVHARASVPPPCGDPGPAEQQPLLRADAPPSAGAAATFDDYPDGVLVMDRLGVVRQMNAAFGSLLGRDAKRTAGQPFQQLVAEEDQSSAAALLTLMQSRRLSDIQLAFSLPQGGWKQLFISTAPARDGRHMLLTARPAGLVHQELEDASRWVAQVHEQSMSLAEAGAALTTKNGALEAAHRDIAQAYAKLQDEIAARERLQHELNLARRLEAIGQLSAGVAHEINTPLQYVGDSVHFFGKSYQLLMRYIQRIDELTSGGPPNSWSDLTAALAQVRREARLQFVLEEVPRAVHAAKGGIEHVSSIVRALKVFSHKGSEAKSPADINAALENTLIVAQNEYRDLATVQARLGELPQVMCCISQLNQVFLNLIVNAAHAIADARRDHPGTITVTSVARDEFVEVSIGDDGCGIPEAIGHRIFEQFFTTKEVGRGAGQGLSLAHQIVVAGHGGNISFESAEGRGTVFTVRLPVSSVDAAPRH